MTTIPNEADLAFAVRDADGVVWLHSMTSELDPERIWTRWEFGLPMKDASERYHFARDQKERGAAIVVVRCAVVGEVDVEAMTEADAFQD